MVPDAKLKVCPPPASEAWQGGWSAAPVIKEGAEASYDAIISDEREEKKSEEGTPSAFADSAELVVLVATETLTATSLLQDGST